MTIYKIKLDGLKDGSYKNSFVIGDKFFEAFPTTEIKCVDIEAKTTLDIEKKKMKLLININGIIKNIPCDLCTDKINIPISHKTNFIIKKSEKSDFFDDNIIYINDNDKEIDLNKILHEMIVLAFPKKRQHKLNSVNGGECDKEMINLIDKFSTVESPKMDPRWEALKSIKIK